MAIDERTGDWIATFSGTKWFITDPAAGDVRIADIAHGLSHSCRFGGQCRKFYSVAQHSVLVSRVLESWRPNDYPLILRGLMHDATEAYLGDMVRPLKQSMPLYKKLEDLTDRVIMRAFGLLPISDQEKIVLKKADNTLLVTERRDLMNHCGHPWSQIEDPMPGQIVPWAPNMAKLFFLARFKELSRLAGIAPIAGALDEIPEVV